jgi:hypothetical protein
MSAVGDTIDGVRSYRFHSLTEEGANELAGALNEDGLKAVVVEPGGRPLPGWVVEAGGDDRSESLLEMLAQFFGGAYEGEDLAGA